MKVTDSSIPLHQVMNLSGPDDRLRDAEILLRYLSIVANGENYRGNLTEFLDATMKAVSRDWTKWEARISSLTQEFNRATELLIKVFPDKKVGRKYSKDGWESRFNRTLYEVQVFYAAKISDVDLISKKDEIVASFLKLSTQSSAFNDTIESTTKSNEKYFRRFEMYQDMMNDVFGTSLVENPLPVPKNNG